MVDGVRWVRVHTTYDTFEAKLLCARLGAEGILCEVRGSADSTYPFGPAHLYVPEADVDDARALLTLADPGPGEVPDGAPLDEPGSARSRPSLRRRVLLVTVAFVLALVALGRVLLSAG